MQIQTERIYLFETPIQDPYFLGEKGGVTAKISPENPRLITDMNIKTVYFYFSGVAKGGFNYSVQYGGEDTDILYTYGKSSASYEVNLNMPIENQRNIEELVGKQFALLGMRRNLDYFVIFGQFECDGLDIDNEVQQRVRFRARNTNAKIFTVQSFNIEDIVVTIDGNELDGGGFDYGFDISFE